MTSIDLTTLVSVLVIITLAALFDVRLLNDLAKTSDWQLRYLNRNAWAVVIVLTFPIGPMLYLLYAKGPGQPR